MAPPPDTTPPTILSVSPANGALGVRADANVVITFTEPMNRASAELAYELTSIPASGASFVWSDDSTVLTVNPDTDLAYAVGTSTSFPSQRSYSLTIRRGAEDAAGNAMENDVAWSFETLLRISQDLVPDQYAVRMGPPAGSVCSGSAFVGDDISNGGSFVVVPINIFFSYRRGSLNGSRPRSRANS